MFEVTRELFHQEMAEAVFAHLRGFLLEKEDNHCQRVEFLPVEVMRIVCDRIAKDVELKKRQVEAYVLADEATTELEIGSGALIEKRNREKFGVLVSFIPQGLRLPAEDSYDIQTFKTYDLGNVLRAHVREMLDALPADGKEIAQTVLSQPGIRRLPVDQHIKYLLALKNDAATWQEAGAYLFHLNLIPDLDLLENGHETRLDRNSKCVHELTDESQSTLSALEELAQKIQLDPRVNSLRENLVSYLRSRNIADIKAWLHDILADPITCANLNFSKWKFVDAPGEGKVEVHLDPLRDPKTNKVGEGLEDRGGNLIANTKTPIKIKWKTYPTNSPSLGHFVVLIVRDTDDEEMGVELLKKTVKNNKKTETRSKISLKDIELSEGEACAAKIIVEARDRSGVILSSDESEPFWIEGGDQEKPTGSKKVNLVRNRAEAFFLGACRSRAKMEVDSEGWEEGRRPFAYRLKLKNREIYHQLINPLFHAIERSNITDPKTLGAWQADLTNRGAMELNDLKPFPLSVTSLGSFDPFVQTRVALFQKIEDKDSADSNPADLERTRSVIEVLDLREYAAEIMDYAKAFIAMLKEVQSKLTDASSDGQVNNILNASHQLSRIDTVHVKVGDAEGEDQLVLLAPTHPIKLLWLLQYQQLLFSWGDKLDGVSEKDATALVSREAHERITSLNIPSVLAFKNDEIYVNSDNFDLYWSILPSGKTSDVRKAVSTLQRLLGFKLNDGEITVITAAHIADRLWRYLKHHPYVSTLRINVINPGDGLLILNAIRLIQKGDDFKDLNYDVAFYADQRYEIMASAFDEMTEGTTLAEGSQPDIDEELLRPNKNPLFPKLTFSKRKLAEGDWRTTDFRESHITILIDRFSTQVLTRQTQPPPGSFCLHNLLAEYRADFDVKGDSATWSRKVVPNQNPELTSAACACAQPLFQAIDGLTRLSASYFDWGNSLDRVPAIQLELSDTDKHLINHIHEHSDWVFTIDRNFGIEYFDNPRSGGGAVRSYLIDYTPEFLDGVGHRLIISTFWLSEIEGIISDGLNKMGIPGTGFHASQILDVLKSISGRLALKLINNPKDAKEIIGLALTRLLLQADGDLKTGILIPIDSHIDLFADHKRASDEADIRLRRSDLIYVHLKDGKLVFRLIEVKYRTGSGAPSEVQLLRDAIAEKNFDTRKVFEARFVPKAVGDRLDRELQNKELANLLRFYFDRSRRHGLLDVSPEGITLLAQVVRQVEEGNFAVEFENAGYIFHTTGISKQPEDYKGNRIYIVGRERILTLLEIEEEPTELPPATEPPPPPVPIAPTTPPTASLTSTPAAAPAPPVPPSSHVTAPPHQATLPAHVAEPASDEQPAPVLTPSPSPVVYSKPAKPPTPKATLVPPVTPGQLRLPLGTNTDNGKQVFWDPAITTPKKLTNQHILIVGKSGAGKTQSASAFLSELANAGVPSIIFDFQGEYISGKLTNGDGQTFLECSKAKELDAANGIHVNPLELPVDPHTGKKQTYLKVVYQVANSLAKIFGLGDIQHAILRDAISQAFAAVGFAPNQSETWQLPPPSFSSIWEILKQMEHTVGGNVRNLNLRIQPLFETGIFLEGPAPQGFEAILKENHILRLSNLATPELMVAVSRFVLQKIYADMLAQGPTHQMRVFAVVDEAHKLSYEETLTELIREARKYGVGILLASQSVKDFDRVVFDMVGTKISLQLEGEDAKVMSENLGLVDRAERDIARQMILNQAPHVALIRSNHFEPYIQARITPFYEKHSPQASLATSAAKPAIQSFDGKYKLEEKLGEGASGAVYRAVSLEDGKTYAVKVLISTGSQLLEAQFRRELEILQKLAHGDSVLAVHDFVREGDKQYLVLDYAEGGNLHDFVTKSASGKLDILETKGIAMAVAKALQSMHEAQIIHRDLKPQNILSVNKVWRIADFGISKYLDRPITAFTLQKSHTPAYSAPEQIAGVEAAPSADIFSFGKLCLFMLEGKPDPELLKYVTSNPMKNLIEHCIEGAPDKRPSSMAEIADRLKYV
jgi:DNA phosphorothioation-dependent restriction protein DptH